MDNFTHCAPLRLQQSEKSINYARTSHNSIFRLVCKMRDTHTAPGNSTAHKAKIRDFYTLLRRSHRQRQTGGQAKSVCFTTGGILSGMWGLQQGLDLNNHVVFLRNDRSTRQLLPTSRMNLGNNSMTATAYTGDCVPTPRASKPKHSLSVPAHTLVIDTTPNGFVCKLAGVPVAWIVCGYHHGQSDGKPKVCHFVDVAYHRQTTRGINLETRDFAILLDAIAFVQSVFKSTVQEGGAQ